MAREIFLNDDYQFLHYVDQRDATSAGAERIPKTGLSVSCYLSLTDVPGTAIANTTTALTEQPAVSGWYAGVLDQTVIATELTAHLGKRIYEIAVITADHTRVTPVNVRRTRVMP